MLRGYRGKRQLTVRRPLKSANQLFGQSLPPDLGDLEITGERLEPTRATTLHSDYLWPLAVSSTVAMLASILVVLVVNELGYSLSFRQSAILFVALFLVAFLVAIAAAYALTQVRETLDEWMPEMEMPSPIELTVNVRGKDDKVVTMHRPKLDVTPEQLLEFVSGVLKAHKGLAVKQWTGRGKMFSRDQYDRFMESCERAGLVERTGAGRQLTEQGEQVFAEIWEKRGDLLK